MSAHVPPDPEPGPSATVRALFACGAALAVTGAGLAWLLAAVSQTTFVPVAWGGGAAMAVIIAAVTVAAYYAEIARSSHKRFVAADREVRRLEREFSDLAGEILPQLARRVRGGWDVDSALARVPGPADGAVQGLLAVVASEIAAAEQRAVAAAADCAAVEEAARQLSEEILPGAIQRMRSGEPAEEVLAEAPHPTGTALGGLLSMVIGEIAVAERRGAAAMAACASAAARIQAQATRMLAELREMENRYGDEKVFADLMELDHRASQMGRMADSIALLAGGRSGRRWTRPIPVESILRGAMGRIDAYQRVRLHSASASAVVGYAAEGVMHALAELMDNAAAFSAHGSEVHVYVEEEDAGAVVTVEDSGLGMRKRERSRAKELVSRPHDLATLPGTRLGLAVVGRVASRYGLSVNFRPSSRGGTGVVVMIPRQLIAQPRLEAGAVADGNGEPTASAVGEGRHDYQDEERGMAPVGDDSDPDDLPVRPRGRTLAAAPGPKPGTAVPPPPWQSRDPAARFAAFRQAGERNRGAPEGPEENAP
jgi:signal transduction histidine kinase